MLGAGGPGWERASGGLLDACNVLHLGEGYTGLC